MDNISLGQAFHHVAQSSAYWVWLIFAAVLLIAAIVFGVKKYNSGDMDGRQITLAILITFAIFIFALLFRPCEVAANTTQEQAARGVYIGY